MWSAADILVMPTYPRRSGLSTRPSASEHSASDLALTGLDRPVLDLERRPRVATIPTGPTTARSTPTMQILLVALIGLAVFLGSLLGAFLALR